MGDSDKSERGEDQQEFKEETILSNPPHDSQPTETEASTYDARRKSKGMRLRLKGHSKSGRKLLKLKKTIDKKEKVKKMKGKKSKESKSKSKRMKYKTAEELLDERVKKKGDKFAWF